MAFEDVCAREALSTLRTRIRTLSGVDPGVFGQVSFTSEASSALKAREGLLSGVNQEVHFEVFVTHKTLSTMRAGASVFGISLRSFL